MKHLKIGIVGGGIAGSAAANFLARQGHTITVFEREENPRPLGAGIMMQQTGYKMMSLLGFKDLIDENSTLIYKFQGVLKKKDKVVIDIDFRDLYPEACGRGVHRGLLFSTLIKELEKIPNVTLLTGMPIDHIDQSKTKIKLHSGKEIFEDYDFVIVSNGSRSMLRDDFSITKKSVQQPISALWATVAYKKNELDENTLTQYYGNKVLTGIMPTGSHVEGDGDAKLVNFFWGVNQQHNPINSTADFQKLKEQINVYYGDSPIAERITNSEQFTFAPYFDSQLTDYYEGRIAFVGDVAHAMSPQLSAGTNLALLDAYMLSECFETETDIDKALRVFSQKRKQQVHYYQTICRLITPIFQGDKQYPFIRDVLMQKLYNLPIVNNMMLSSLMGIRDGWLSKLPKRYYI